MKILHFLLLKIPPELAHDIGMWLLRGYQAIFGGRRSEVRCVTGFKGKMGQLRFPSRLGLAAGFDKNAAVFPALSRMGFGFIEVGTVTPEPQPGNPKPRIWRESGGAVVNHLGFNSQGLVRFCRNLEWGRAKTDIPLFANIGKNKETPNEKALEDYAKCLTAIEPLVDGFVVNLSSPNTPSLRDLQEEKFLESVAAILPRSPVFIKLAPDLADGELTRLAGYVRKSPYAGIVLTNTSRALAQARGYKNGGLSGKPLFSRAIEAVSVARAALGGEKTLIGVGGVASSEDYLKMRAAGADLVEVYTAFIYRGASWSRKLATLASVK